MEGRVTSQGYFWVESIHSWKTFTVRYDFFSLWCKTITVRYAFFPYGTYVLQFNRAQLKKYFTSLLTCHQKFVSRNLKFSIKNIKRMGINTTTNNTHMRHGCFSNPSMPQYAALAWPIWGNWGVRQLLSMSHTVAPVAC
jgi:hypothetical protein